jgi:hypothetical protein
VAAANSILDRGLGKPLQGVELSGKDGARVHGIAGDRARASNILPRKRRRELTSRRLSRLEHRRIGYRPHDGLAQRRARSREFMDLEDRYGSRTISCSNRLRVLIQVYLLILDIQTIRDRSLCGAQVKGRSPHAACQIGPGRLSELGDSPLGQKPKPYGRS